MTGGNKMLKRTGKALCLLLSCVLLMSLFAGLWKAGAVNGAAISVESGEVTASAEGLVTLTVNLTDNPGFTYGTFRVKDSQGLLKLKSVTTGLSGASAAVGKNNLFSVSTLEPGSNVTASGVLATLTLEAAGNGTTSVSVELKNDDAEMLVNASRQAVPVSFTAGSVTVKGAEANSCVSVKEAANTAFELTAGGMEAISLSELFTDADGHKLSYELLNAGNYSHTTKIAGSVLYFSEKDAGSYTATIRATCADGLSAEVTLNILVNAAPEGLPIQYDYDETPAEKVTVFATVSSDGVPLMGNDRDSTILSHLEVTIPYFDLAEYGIADYYRYAADKGGSYIGDTVIKRPTAMHLFIYLVQRYYMGLPEKYCGPGGGDSVSYQGKPTNPLNAEGGLGVYTMQGDEAFKDNGTALEYTGGAQSTYMKLVWGHDENLMYYRNHAYPLQSPGWGSTADYILLSDGDTIDMAMFTNWNFYQYGSFCTFVDRDTRVNDGGKNGDHTDSNYRPATAFTATAGESTVFSAVRFGTKSVAEGGSDEFGPISDDAYAASLSVGVYDEDWNDITQSEAVTSWQDDGKGHYTVTFAKAGTYYLLGMDGSSGTKDACIAPATAKIVVSEAAVMRGDVNGDGDISGADVQKLRNHILGKSLLTGPQPAAADVDGDGEITGADVQRLRNFLLGKLESLD